MIGPAIGTPNGAITCCFYLVAIFFIIYSPLFICFLGRKEIPYSFSIILLLFLGSLLFGVVTDYPGSYGSDNPIWAGLRCWIWNSFYFVPISYAIIFTELLVIYLRNWFMPKPKAQKHLEPEQGQVATKE